MRSVILLLLALALSSFAAEAIATQRSLSRDGQDDLSTRGSENAAATDDGDEAENTEDNEDKKDDDDEDDSDDDSDDDQVPATGPKKAKNVALVAKKKPTPSDLAKEEDAIEKQLKMKPHAEKEARLKEEVTKAEKKLVANLHEQSELKERVKDLSDKVKSDDEIDTEAGQVANQTDSAALGDMMGDMWKDMRMFDVPSYAKYAEEELTELEHDEHKLEEKVKAAEHKLSDAQKKWGIATAEDTEKHEKGHRKEHEEEEDEEEHHEDEKKHAHKRHSEATAGTKTADMTSWNFWQMSSNKQVSFFLSSLVYVVAGVALAYLYNMRRTKEAVFTPDERQDKVSLSQFSFSLFGCFATPAITVMGCCCPCLRWADTMDRGTMDGKPVLPYWKAFAAFFTLLVLHCYTWGLSWIALVVLGVWFRQKLRENYGIESRTPASVTTDILAWLCCQPCAIIQEAREQSIARTPNNV